MDPPAQGCGEMAQPDFEVHRMTIVTIENDDTIDYNNIYI